MLIGWWKRPLISLFVFAVMGGPPPDWALSGCQVPRHRHSPGWNQEGPAGFGPARSSGKVLSKRTNSGGTDQSHICRPLHSGHGESLVDFFFFYAFTNWPAFSKLIMLHSGTRGRQDGRNGFSIAGTICPEAPAGRRRYEMFFCSQNSLTDRSQDKCK